MENPLKEDNYTLRKILINYNNRFKKKIRKYKLKNKKIYINQNVIIKIKAIHGEYAFAHKTKLIYSERRNKYALITNHRFRTSIFVSLKTDITLRSQHCAFIIRKLPIKDYEFAHKSMV